MRVVKVLCDRCRAEMPASRRKRPMELDAVYRPLEGPALVRTRVRIELCDECAVSFTGWLGETCTLPGLIPIEEAPEVEPVEEPMAAEPAPGPLPPVPARLEVVAKPARRKAPG